VHLLENCKESAHTYEYGSYKTKTCESHDMFKVCHVERLYYKGL
jgi:hypothetical protein